MIETEKQFHREIEADGYSKKKDREIRERERECVKEKNEESKRERESE